MATIIRETRRSKARLSGPDPWERREYRVWDPANPTLSPSTVETAIGGFAPGVIGALPLQKIEIVPDDAHQGVFTCNLEYAKSAKREVVETGQEEIGWDLTPQTVKLIQSPHGSHLAKYAASGTAPDFKGGIGFDSANGGFQGTDVYVELFSFWITKYIPKATAISNAFTLGLRNCAFKYNNAPFRGQAAGECLFFGARGAPRNKDDHSVTFNFLCSANATGLTIGDITGVDKLGWNYLWVLFEQTHDTTGKYITPRPKAAYVERVYKPADFPTLLTLTA